VDFNFPRGPFEFPLDAGGVRITLLGLVLRGKEEGGERREEEHRHNRTDLIISTTTHLPHHYCPLSSQTWVISGIWVMTRR